MYLQVLMENLLFQHWINLDKIKKPFLKAFRLERVMGIEPTQSAWKAEVLPLNYTRKLSRIFL